MVDIYNVDGIDHPHPPSGENVVLLSEVEVLIKAALGLLALKGGPRDEHYEQTKPLAWGALRDALKPFEDSQ